jgi:hypothetical protein
MHGQPTSRLGCGLAARSTCAAACAHERSRARSARPRRGHRVRDGTVACLPTGQRRLRRGAPREHQRLFVVTPGKADGGGAYPNNGAAGSRKRGSGQRRSPVGRELRWVATTGVGSCSTGVEGGREN